MTDNEYYNYLLSCGFTEDEANKKMEEAEIMTKLYSKPKEPREITSSTYKRAEKRLHKEVENFMGFDRR